MQEVSGGTFEDADAEVGYGSLGDDKEGCSEGDVGDIRRGGTSALSYVHAGRNMFIFI